MAELVLSLQEREAIKALKVIARNWPRSLWLYSSNGSLHVMRKVDGKRVMVRQSSPGPGFDQNYIVETIKIENDGGDW